MGYWENKEVLFGFMKEIKITNYAVSKIKVICAPTEHTSKACGRGLPGASRQ